MAFKAKKDELLFLPLGGANEIGMNVNLYCYKGKWLMFDLGAGFADEFTPGVDMLAPKLDFVYDNIKDLLGIVLTHAHEDHIGSLVYLWGQLRCPIYTTPFTAAVIKAKLAGEGMTAPGKIHEVQSNSTIDIGPFKIELVQITHSIPEMNGAIIKTEFGNVMHTGDWKIDPDPVIGPTTDEARLKAYGDEGVLCMVCDSTNILKDGTSGSEGELIESITKLISEQKNFVAVSTFASNVARLETLAKAAKANGRAVALLGRSLGRIVGAAQECGYLLEYEFIDERKLAKMPRDKVMAICTGCQGEPQAAMARLAVGDHPAMRLVPGDTVIFSSKVIPGNEKKIFRLYNKLIHRGIDVITEKDHFVHVSGHPCRDEIKRMYEFVRPQISIPVHGESLHIHEHIKFARELGVPQQVEVENGSVVKIAPGKAQVIGQVESGYLGVDGYMLIPTDGRIMSMRRKLMKEGIVFVFLVMDKKGNLKKRPVIHTPGVLDESENAGFVEDIEQDVADVLKKARNMNNDDKLATLVRKTIRNFLKREIGKYPAIKVEIARV